MEIFERAEENRNLSALRRFRALVEGAGPLPDLGSVAKAKASAEAADPRRAQRERDLRFRKYGRHVPKQSMEEVAAEWRAMRVAGRSVEGGGGGGSAGDGGSGVAAAAAAVAAATAAAASGAATSVATAATTSTARFGSVLDLAKGSRFVYTSGGADDDIVYGADLRREEEEVEEEEEEEEEEEADEARRVALSRLRQALGEEEWDIAAM